MNVSCSVDSVLSKTRSLPGPERNNCMNISLFTCVWYIITFAAEDGKHLLNVNILINMNIMLKAQLCFVPY